MCDGKTILAAGRVQQLGSSAQTAKGYRARRHLRDMKLIESLVLLAIGSSMGWACSCAPSSGCWSASSEGLEFVGKATRVHASGGGAVAVDFAVSEAFGKLSGKTAVTVYTNTQSTACGYHFAWASSILFPRTPLNRVCGQIPAAKPARHLWLRP